MSKKLKTKYLDFIKEDLYIKGDVYDIISDMSKIDLVATLLSQLSGSRSYPDDSQINWVTLGETINTLQYVAKNKRDQHTTNNWDKQKVEIRVGRLIRKIISDVDRSKLKINYKGTAIIGMSSISGGSPRKSILFTKDITDDFSKTWMSSTEHGFIISFDNQENNDIIDMSSSEVILKVSTESGTKSFSTSVYDFLDNTYHMHWNGFNHKSFYFNLQLTDSIDIGSESILYRDGKPVDDISNYVYEIDLEVVNKFGGKTIDQINDSDIEKFVNEFISRVKMVVAPEGSTIEEVKGDEIKKWYLENSYQKKSGQLGGSCMSGPECSNYFDIYTENKEEVSLLILKSVEGKLLGRALLWKLDSGKYFMDRVYTITDYDVKIFIKYAIEHGYYYRNNGGNNTIEYFFNGTKIDKPKDLIVSLNDSSFDYYPYMDTMKDLDLDSNTLHYEDDNYNTDRELRSTEGKWTGYEEEEDGEGDEY